MNVSQFKMRKERENIGLGKRRFTVCMENHTITSDDARIICVSPTYNSKFVCKASVKQV